MKKELLAAVDVCDVAVDLHNTVVKILNLKLPSKINDWDMFSLLSENDCSSVLKLFNDQDFWRNLPPIQGVHEGIEKLKSLGYKIHWLTSPWADCKNWEGIRRTWLKEQKLINDVVHDITFTSQKYRFDADILIDDRPKHIKLWSAMHPGKLSLLYNSRFNEYFEWSDRIQWSKDLGFDYDIKSKRV